MKQPREGFSNLHLESLISMIKTAEDRIPIADQQAADLEKKAHRLRMQARERYVGSFATASAALIEQIDAGELTPREILESVVRISELDFAMKRRGYDASHGAENLQAFDELVPNTPVVGLSVLNRDVTNFGIVSSRPSEVTVQTRKISLKDKDAFIFQLAPTAIITVPLKVIENGTEHEIPVQTDLRTLREATIGFTAVKALVERATFTLSSDGTSCHPGTITNSMGLKALRKEVDVLYELGMDTIDTSRLDAELAVAQAYNKPKGVSRRFVRSPYARRNY